MQTDNIYTETTDFKSYTLEDDVPQGWCMWFMDVAVAESELVHEISLQCSHV